MPTTNLRNAYNVGDIVTFSNHPMFENYRIKGDSRYVPPIMIVKEVHFDPKKKIADESTGKIIAEKIKYNCVYFDDNKGIFVELFFYESTLRSFEDLLFERINNNGLIKKDYKSLIDEVKGYSIPSYEYGKLIYFKTVKLEIYKKRTSKKITLNANDSEGKVEVKEILQYVVNYASPQFVIVGYKEECHNDLFYPDGKRKKIAPKNFIKIKWFNPFQNKFIEEFLPEEFFTDEDVFANEIKHQNNLHNPAKNKSNVNDFDEGKNRHEIK